VLLHGLLVAPVLALLLCVAATILGRRGLVAAWRRLVQVLRGVAGGGMGVRALGLLGVLGVLGVDGLGE